MKIVISPAKSLDFTTKVPTDTFTMPFFQDEIKIINNELKTLSPQTLSELMSISAKLAELNWQRNQDFSLPFSLENSRQAVFAFNGDVYEGLDAYSLTNQEIEVLQQQLRILSGLYGIVKPLDLIQPYRLEMGTKISIGKSANLYAFWREKITNWLLSELDENELFVNLASNEYFDAVDAKRIPNLITPIFKDWKDDKLKIISFYAKKARGLMVRYIIKQKAQTIEDLKGFNYEGYSFSEDLSKGNELVFVR